MDQDFRQAFEKLKNFHGTNLSPEDLKQQIFGYPPKPGSSHRGYNTYPPFTNPESNLKALNDKLAALKQRPVDKVRRKKDIEHELDIVRGRIPTPKGYTISPLRIKQLMTELKSL